MRLAKWNPPHNRSPVGPHQRHRHSPSRRPRSSNHSGRCWRPGIEAAPPRVRSGCSNHPADMAASTRTASPSRPCPECRGGAVPGSSFRSDPRPPSSATRRHQGRSRARVQIGEARTPAVVDCRGGRRERRLRRRCTLQPGVWPGPASRSHVARAARPNPTVLKNRFCGSVVAPRTRTTFRTRFGAGIPFARGGLEHARNRDRKAHRVLSKQRRAELHRRSRVISMGALTVRALRTSHIKNRKRDPSGIRRRTRPPRPRRPSAGSRQRVLSGEQTHGGIIPITD